MNNKELSLNTDTEPSENIIFIDREWNMKPSVKFQNPDGDSIEITHDWKFLREGKEINDPKELGSLLMKIAEQNKKEGYALWS